MLAAAVLAVIGIGVGVLAARGGGLPTRESYTSASAVLTALGCSNISAQSINRSEGECSLASDQRSLDMTAVMVPPGSTGSRYVLPFATQEAGNSNALINFVYGSNWLVTVPVNNLKPWVAHFGRLTGFKLGSAWFIQAVGSSGGNRHVGSRGSATR